MESLHSCKQYEGMDHSLIQLVFIEHPLCARSYCKCWRYSSKQDRPRPTYSKDLTSTGGGGDENKQNNVQIVITCVKDAATGDRTKIESTFNILAISSENLNFCLLSKIQTLAKGGLCHPAWP